MARSTEEARQAVVRARTNLAIEMNDLGAAARSAVDVPAKVRKRPVETAGLAAGAAFLAVGGPKRVLRGVQRRLGRTPKYKGSLPRDVEKALRDSGVRQDEVKARIEKDFAAYLEEKGSGRGSANFQASFWKTYDVLVGPVGKLAAAKLTQKLFASEPDRPSARGEGERLPPR